MNEKEQNQQGALAAYPISFQIYAHSAEEAEKARMALVAFIGMHAQAGRAVTGEKIAKAAANWDKNPFVKNRIIDYFK